MTTPSAALAAFARSLRDKPLPPYRPRVPAVDAYPCGHSSKAFNTTLVDKQRVCRWCHARRGEQP